MKKQLILGILGIAALAVILIIIGVRGVWADVRAAPMKTDVSGDITTNTTWTLAGSPYILTSNVVVAAGVTLTIEPGVVVMGQDWKRLWVEGHLEAVGTASQPITFTSATDSGPYQWAGLVFDGGTGHLRHATVRYGGYHDTIANSNITVRNVLTDRVRIESSRVISISSGATDGGLYVVNSHVVVSDTLFSDIGNATGDHALYATGASSVVTVTGSTFQNNSGYGIYAGSGAEMAVTDSTIQDNGNAGIRVNGATVSVAESGFAGNGNFGIENISSSTTVQAAYNWWGHSSGPYHPDTNPDGLGDQVSDDVAYDPWLIVPAGSRHSVAFTNPSGLLRTGVDHVDVVFTQPIASETFTEDDVFLWGPDGEIPITGIAFVEETAGAETYRVSFPLQEAEGTYSVSIGPNITDLNGEFLDQDHDWTGGEPIDDVYEGSFTIDTTGPRITRHQPSGDNVGSAEYVDVWFSETTNSETFTTASVTVTGPGGNITPSAVTEIGFNSYRFSFPVQTALGEYHVEIAPDIEDLAGNLMDQDRDGAQGETDEDAYEASFNLVDVDLTLSNVVIDAAELWAGELVNVSWDGSNDSGMALLGDWTDAVYLSADDQWDIDDELLATVSHTGGLAQDEVYSESVGAAIPGAIPGDYYLIVRADLYNQEKEGGDEGNNIVPVGPIPLDVRPLAADGVPVSSTLTETDRVDYYAVSTVAGANLSIVLDGLAPGASAELFVSYETVPTRLDYDHRATVNMFGNQQVVIAGTLAGTYYVHVYGDQLNGPSSYNVTATDLGELFVAGITPAGHSILSVCTATLVGAGFDESTTVEFVGSDSSIRTPTETQLLSSTTMMVTLDVPNWPVDVYDIVVTKPSIGSYELTDAFEVSLGEPHLDASIIVPSSLGRHWLSTLWIEYENTGDSSIAAPLFKLEGSDDAIMTLDSSVARQNLWTSRYPVGTDDIVFVMAAGSGATPGILQPGDSGRIPVYYLGLKRPWDFSDRTIEFILGTPISSLPDSIDWASLKDEMRPEAIPADAWEAIWANFTDQVGDNTWGDYVSMLNDNMNYLGNIGQDTDEVSSLLTFEMQQASTIWPFTYLSGDIDAFVPAPGLPLAFSRGYRQAIDSRYALGSLGRGWKHSWDIYAEELSDGDAIVHGPNGADRYFTKDGSSYTASPGDYGTLTTSGGSYRLTEKYGTVWRFRSDNLLDYVEDTNGNRITAGYDAGQLTSLTHSNGDQLLLDYNANGRIWHVTDPRGAGTEDDHVTTFEYDASSEYLLSVTAPGNRVTTYTYETAGTLQQRHALLSVEYPDATHNYFTYDDHGRLIQTHRDGGAEAVTYSYDSAGTVTLEDATGQQTRLYFGLGGQLAQARDGEGNVLGMAYDSNYQLTGLTGPSGEEYGYSYDAQGNVIGIEDPVRQTTAFAYETSFNNLGSVTDARANGMEYDYDASGNLTSITYEDGASESFTYDSSGNVLTWTNRRGDTVTYTYNAAGQLTSKDYSGTPEVTDYTYDYDAAGNLISATDATGTISMTYGPDTDWLERIDYPGGQFFTFEYNDAGRRTKRTDQDGNVVNYIYDGTGRLDQIRGTADGLIVDYDYDTAGWLILKTLGNGVYTTYDYDNARRLLHLVNYDPTDAVLSRFDYTYDASGRRTTMTTLDGTYTYSYDPLGQLTSVTYPDSHVVEYVYDAVGNRIEVIDDDVATDYTTNDMNQYTDVGDVTYTYDADGSMVTKTESGVTTTYTYNIENRLIGVTTPTDTWTYTYDALGNRIASTHNGVTTNYIIDPMGLGNVAVEYDDNGTLIARYDHGFGLLARADLGGTSAYYSFDALGSASELTDPAGAVLNSYTYDPFGISLEKQETIPNLFKYVGEFGVMDDESGLNYMRTRYYQLDLGRFTTEDLLKVPGRNGYAYVANNPTDQIDPVGLQAKEYDPNIKWPQWMYYRDSNPSWPYSPPDYGYYSLYPRRSWEEQLQDVRDFLEAIQPIIEAWCAVTPGCFSSDPDLFRPVPIPNPPTDPAGEGSPGIAGARDPNDKIAPAGYGGAKFIPEDEKLLAYTIRFENQPEATAPAHIIRVTDTLDDDLDLSTFELTDIAFADQTIIVPPGLNHYETSLDLVVDNELASEGEIRCEIAVSLDTSTRELTLEMMGLDPQTGWLPEDIMLGILYPNDDSGRGDGHISYLIKHNDGLATGTEITNKATIYFDWNDPIDTPLVLNTIDAGVPSSEVDDLPAKTPTLEFLVSWSGEDDTGGSGIASYAIYVSDNGGDYSLWLDATTEAQATFIGEYDHTYRFYGVATDNVGHQESPPAEADAETTVSPSLADLGLTKTDSSDPVMASGTLTYTIVVTNSGPDAANGVVITDTLPLTVTFASSSTSQGACSGTSTVTCSLGTINDGSSVTATIVVTPAAAGTIANTVTVTATTPDPTLGNNTATEDTTITTEADLVIVKSDNPDPVVAGETLTYTLVITNTGPSVATGVTVTDTLPLGVTFGSAAPSQGGPCNEAGGAITCSLGTMTSGNAATVTIVVTVDSSTTGMLLNPAGVTATTTDHDPGNNVAVEYTTVQGCYDFSEPEGVGVEDIMLVASRWRTSCDNPDPDNNPNTPNYEARYDLDGDCDIDIVDIMLVVVHWGESCE